VHGANDEAVEEATVNAHRIIGLERALHIFYESQVQQAFLHQTWFISFLDDFYGSAHFVAVAAVLAWLFFAQPTRYRFWRNVLAACTALALVGFAAFPLLPPRLLPSSYHFVDTLRVVGGLWNFSGGPVNDVSNQYAAMPSLHTGWSTWCACAAIPAVRPRWAKVALFVYPALTVFCIVVTANHFFLDAVGGLLALGLAFVMVGGAQRYWPRPRSARHVRRHARGAPEWCSAG
jgi:hypothetical protein